MSYRDKNGNDLQIDDVLVLSTAHLSQRTDTALIEEALHDLRDHGVTDGKDHGGMPATMLFPCGDGFYGYMVWADVGFKDMAVSKDHPELVTIIDFAVNRGCQWIRFDVDAALVSELPTFTWEEKAGYWHRDSERPDESCTSHPRNT